MANSNTPFGLRPLRSLSGGSITMNTYFINPTHATPIYGGDLVVVGDGKEIIGAASGVKATGVLMGCSWVTAQGEPQWSLGWPGVADGKTQVEALVIDDPQIIYECQAANMPANGVGLKADCPAGVGSLVSGHSTQQATVSAETGSLHVMGLSQRHNNEYGAYAKIEVRLIT